MNQSTAKGIFEEWKQELLKRNRKQIQELLEQYWYDYINDDYSRPNLFRDFMKKRRDQKNENLQRRS